MLRNHTFAFSILPDYLLTNVLYKLLTGNKLMVHNFLLWPFLHGLFQYCTYL